MSADDKTETRPKRTITSGFSVNPTRPLDTSQVSDMRPPPPTREQLMEERLAERLEQFMYDTGREPSPFQIAEQRRIIQAEFANKESELDAAFANQSVLGIPHFAPAAVIAGGILGTVDRFTGAPVRGALKTPLNPLGGAIEGFMDPSYATGRDILGIERLSDEDIIGSLSPRDIVGGVAEGVSDFGALSGIARASVRGAVDSALPKFARGWDSIGGTDMPGAHLLDTVPSVYTGGKNGLIAALKTERERGFIPDDVEKIGTNFINNLPEPYLKSIPHIEMRGHIYDSAAGSAAGAYWPREMKVAFSRFSLSYQQGGGEVIMHELAHHLAQFVPESTHRILRGIYQEGRTKGLTYVYNDETYRWSSYGEFFAEIMSESGARRVAGAATTPAQKSAVVQLFETARAYIRTLIDYLRGTNTLEAIPTLEELSRRLSDEARAIADEIHGNFEQGIYSSNGTPQSGAVPQMMPGMYPDMTPEQRAAFAQKMGVSDPVSAPINEISAATQRVENARRKLSEAEQSAIENNNENLSPSFVDDLNDALLERALLRQEKGIPLTPEDRRIIEWGKVQESGWALQHQSGQNQQIMNRLTALLADEINGFGRDPQIDEYMGFLNLTPEDLELMKVEIRNTISLQSTRRDEVRAFIRMVQGRTPWDQQLVDGLGFEDWQVNEIRKLPPSMQGSYAWNILSSVVQ